jgi:predicted permease
MQNLSLSFYVVLPLFFMMAIGALLKKLRLADSNTFKQMNRITFQVFLPTLIFTNIYHTQGEQVFNAKLVGYSLISVICIFWIVFLIIWFLEKDNKKRGVLIQGIFRSNFVLFGLPVATALFGAQAKGVTALLIAVIIPVYNMFSVVALEAFRGNGINGKNILKGIATNPLILSSIIGVGVLYTGVPIPSVIDKTLTDLSAIATPLALIILGGSLNLNKVGGYKKQLLLGLLGRLVFVPLVGLGVGAVAFGFRGVDLAVLLSMFAAPTAVSSFTMAQQMGGDEELAGQLVAFGSIFSVGTIFLWIFLFKQIGFM